MAGVRLHLDQARWREHLRTVAGATPGLVPVIKGNGYGFGLQRLAAESSRLGADAVAVGLPREVAEVRNAYPGDLVVLTPYDRDDPIAQDLTADHRVISTVSRLADLERLAQADGEARVLIEVRTSMLRHGLTVDELARTRDAFPGVRFEGWSLHLPMVAGGRYAEAERLARAALDAAPGPLWISHLPPEETAALARQLGGAEGDPVPVRQRVGTRLWLGDPSSRRTTATVLDLHPVRRGDRAGYRQRRIPADGWVVVLAGGTAHGIGMEAPTSATSSRQRVIALATGSLEAAGLALSPYTLDGRKRWFLEPPHMQASLVFLPRSARPPAVGDEVPVELRLTTAVVDEILS